MDDAVEFLDQVKKNVTGAEESKVVMMAGMTRLGLCLNPLLIVQDHTEGSSLALIA